MSSPSCLCILNIIFLANLLWRNIIIYCHKLIYVDFKEYYRIENKTEFLPCLLKVWYIPFLLLKEM